MMVACNQHNVQMIRGSRQGAARHMAAAASRGILYGNITVSL